jgi:catechol 2,3-dioxygenase-like lactoylglutathione lyase family enzyme
MVRGYMMRHSSCHVRLVMDRGGAGPYRRRVNLHLEAFDHLVLTAGSAEATLDFYCRVLGMEQRSLGEGRIALHFGASKINVHVAPPRIEPRAAAAAPGTVDVCILSTLAPRTLASALASRGAVVELGPVQRNGARGLMTSFYLRDPDGNLVEIATYEE